METGTGKTYVYLRTIFELNKRYGFTKFVIVVPSVAIKEGVYKTLQITEEHFRGLYANTPFDYFLYDSSKLGQVRNFATSPHIQIMVVTVGAINKKDVNNLYKDSEKTGGEKPIDLIRATRPILIVDEPQSVDGGLQGAARRRSDAMNPLCTLRYSATHVDKHHMVYRLDAVDAYERKLVKQIEVASATVEGAHNKPYVRLVSVSNKRGSVIGAKVELDVQTAQRRAAREDVTVQDGDDLEQTTGRALYADYRIGEIRAAKGDEFMELRYPGGEDFLRLGQAYGDVDATGRAAADDPPHHPASTWTRRSACARRASRCCRSSSSTPWRSTASTTTTATRSRASTPASSRRSTAGSPSIPDYQTLFKDVDLTSTAEEVHDGYFSIDKKGDWLDTAENNQANRDNAERAYNLIMRDKEKLLSFETR